VPMDRRSAAQVVELARHARWAFPTSSGLPVLRRGRWPAWLERLAAEANRLEDAARTLRASGDQEAALELAANAWRVFIVAGDLPRGRAFLAAVLDPPSSQPSAARAVALYGDGLLAFLQGDLDTMRRRSEQALEAARASADGPALVLAHLGLSRAAFADGDYAQARTLAGAARELADGLAPAMGQAPLHMRAQATRLLGGFDEAASLLRASLALNRRLGDEGMVAVELHNLGHVELHRGGVDAAARHFAELAETSPHDDPYSRAMAALNEGVLALARGDRARAAALLERLDVIIAAEALEPAPDDAFEIAALRRRLAA
jgi:ATP/maltotriose-dependent transcriptional regulator MalT